jgi:hypothetical protein
MLILFCRYFPHDGHEAWIAGLLNNARVNIPAFNEKFQLPA